MFIVYANSIVNELVADRIKERTPVSEIIGLASTVEEAKIMIIEHAKDRVNEDYADGFASTREESWADYMTKEGIVQEDAGPAINYMQYMARRVIFKTTAVTDAGVPFTVQVQYNPEFYEYRLTCFTAACSQQSIENRACYTDDKEDAMSTIHHMQAEFRRNHTA